MCPAWTITVAAALHPPWNHGRTPVPSIVVLPSLPHFFNPCSATDTLVEGILEKRVMVLLKSLHLPALTPEMLRFFAEQQVFTVEDFLCHDLQSLAIEADRSLVTLAFNQAVRAVLSYLENYHEDWSLGSELLEGSGQFLPIGCARFHPLVYSCGAYSCWRLERESYFPEGHLSVDSLLNGGLQEGTITELVGASSTGKSQLCMQAAASVAYWLHSTVIYVDTCRTFSGKRVAEILESFLGRHQTRMKDQENSVRLVMKCIQRIGIFDVFSMLSFLRSLHGSLQSKHPIGGDFSHLRLLIIDSASSVVSPILGATNSRGHSLMISMARCLNKLAIINRIAVLITNHTVTGDEGQIQAALGESWMAVPHVRLWLARDSNSDTCEVSLSKHTSLACNKQAAFYIDTSGLQSIDNFRNSITPSSPSH